jgi:hypothetical protein
MAMNRSYGIAGNGKNGAHNGPPVVGVRPRASTRFAKIIALAAIPSAIDQLSGNVGKDGNDAAPGWRAISTSTSVKSQRTETGLACSCDAARDLRK